jgi:hypothetical protein
VAIDALLRRARVVERDDSGIGALPRAGQAGVEAGMSSPDTGAAEVIRGSALPSTWRIVAGACFALSRASLPLILLAALLLRDPPLSATQIVALAVSLSLLPGLAAALVQIAYAAQVELRDGHLVTSTPRRRVEIPVTALGEIRPWRVPLPRPGFWLHTRSGRRMSAGLAPQDPEPLLQALAGAGAESARGALAHPGSVYAHARAAQPRRFWQRAWFKLGVFGLLPAAVLFRAQQVLTYGSAFGEWQLRGPAAWLETAAGYALLTLVYLLLYASVWRGLAEGAAWLAARSGPARAAAVRSAGELVCALAYYLGVPALLAWRFLT